MPFQLRKTGDDEQLVFGWASIAVDEHGQQIVDLQGDMIDPGELERTAYDHVLRFRSTGERHDEALRAKGDLIESVVFTPEKRAALGIPDGTVPDGWWVGYHITDAETWRKIKSGEYEMFSIDGRAECAEAGKAVVAKSFRECLAEYERGQVVAKSFIECLAKYNHNHDQLGRFASSRSYAPDRGGPIDSVTVSPKQQKRINEFKKKLRTGYADSVPLRRKEGIDKHDPSKAEFGKYAQMRKLAGKPPQSKFTVKPESIEKEIREKLKVKTLEITHHGDAEFHAHIELDRVIGMSYDVHTKNMVETSRLTAVFSERYGMHYYPTLDDD